MKLVFHTTIIFLFLIGQIANGKSVIQQVLLYQNTQTLFADVQTQINFPSAVKEAIHSGIQLTFQYQFKLTNDKWYKVAPIAKLNKSYHVSYHRMTNQYMVNDPITFETKEFDSLHGVQQFLQQLQAFPVILVSQRPETPTHLSVRFYLSSSNLPSYVRIERYFDDDWEVDSDWSRWQLP